MSAATRALAGEGLNPDWVLGRDRSNIWEIRENGNRRRVSIRTTKDSWFVFPPLKKGTAWKTLDDVDIVIVAAVDDRDDPRNVAVYRFNAAEVRAWFDASYAARIEAGQTVRDDFGVWVNRRGRLRPAGQRRDRSRRCVSSDRDLPSRQADRRA
ncbi:MAG: hypothetical protein IPM60_14355 [Rhodospirillales bacterium]|nr:hypothetical protein [Rhodospirillales bacterium]